MVFLGGTSDDTHLLLEYRLYTMEHAVSWEIVPVSFGFGPKGARRAPLQNEESRLTEDYQNLLIPGFELKKTF